MIASSILGRKDRVGSARAVIISCWLLLYYRRDITGAVLLARYYIARYNKSNSAPINQCFTSEECI